MRELVIIFMGAGLGLSLGIAIVLSFFVDKERIRRWSVRNGRHVTVREVVAGKIDPYNVDGQLDPTIAAGFSIDSDGRIITNGRRNPGSLRSAIR